MDKTLHSSRGEQTRHQKAFKRHVLVGASAFVVLLVVVVLLWRLRLVDNAPHEIEATPNIALIDLNERHHVVKPYLADVLYPMAHDPSLQVPAEEDMPWYYGDMELVAVSRWSTVHQEQLVADLLDEQMTLYRTNESHVFRGVDGDLYSGWVSSPYGTLLQINDGKLIQTVSQYPYDESAAFRGVLTGEISDNFLQAEVVDYAIWYTKPKQIIWTLPEGVAGAVSHETTEYENFPMEVEEEAIVNGKKWLHVYNGYTEIGWVPEDSTQQDYHETEYSELEMLETIAQVMEEEMSVIGGPAGASFVNNRTLAQVDVDNQVFMPASTQKIYVFAELHRQYKEGKLTPDTIATMTEDDLAGGAGIIIANGVGSQYTLDELVNMVAIYSDNTAANMLIEAVGGGAVITPHVHEWGMMDTYVDGKYYHERNGLFQTTPHDAALLFAKLARRELNGEPWDSMMIDKLRMNTHTFLRNYIYGEDSWNKSGLGEPEQNDVATFVTPYGSYSIAVYTSSWMNHDNRYDEVGRLSARVYDVYNEYQSRIPYE